MYWYVLIQIGVGWLPCSILQYPPRMPVVLHQPQAVHSPFSSWHAELAIFCRGARAVFRTSCLIYSSLWRLDRTSFPFTPSSKELTPFLWFGWGILIDAKRNTIFVWVHKLAACCHSFREASSRAKKSLNSQQGSNSSSQSQWTTPGKWRVWGATLNNTDTAIYSLMSLIDPRKLRNLRSQTSDLWAAAATVVRAVREEKKTVEKESEMSEETESVERRSRCVKKYKNRETLCFPMFWGFGRSKSRLAKAADCTPKARHGAKHISKSKC